MKILEHEAVLNAASDVLGDLDCFVALSQGARKYNLVPPHMTTENVIDISGGRHPLQELTVPSYVTNNTFLIGGAGDSENEDDMEQMEYDDVEGPSLLLMTGPNYSGKSVYLKQTALIVYMAQIGSFVPAESATIGLTDKILTRIATRESVSRTQSAFMIDLQQIALAAGMASRRSLVIIDEFGKGTNAADGAGLACGIFEYFLSLGPNCPKVLGATHFHEIFENNALQPRPELAFGHMEVHVDGEQSLDEQVTYLYSFVLGRSMASFGTICAAMNGIDPAVVERADELIILASRGEDLIAACARMGEVEKEKLEEAERVARGFLELDLDAMVDEEVGLREVLKRVLKSID